MMLIHALLFTISVGLGGMALGDFPEVRNPSEAPRTRIIEMEEVWRVGGDPDEDFVLGVIIDVFADANGRIYLFDMQQKEVFQFDADGNYLQSVIRQGEGPGEINLCWHCNLFQGLEVGCLNGSPQRIVKVDAEGLPLGDIPLQPMDREEDLGRPSAYSFQARDGYLLVSGTFNRYEPDENQSWNFLSAFDAAGNEIYNFGIQPTGYDFSKAIVVDEEGDFWPLGNWVLGPEGRVYTAPRRTEYYLEVQDTEGNLLRTITRPWPRRQRTEEEKQEARSHYSFASEGELPPISYRMSDYDQALQNLFWVEDHLWVISSRFGETWTEERTGFIDILDAEGHLLENRAYEVPVRRDKDQVFWLGDETVAVVRNIDAAMDNYATGWDRQSGDEKVAPGFQEDVLLEVVLYRGKL